MELKDTFMRMAKELEELATRLSDPATISDQYLFRDLSRRHSELQGAVDMWREYEQAVQDRDDAEALLAETADEEMREFIEAERQEAAEKVEALHNRLLLQLVPRDPMDSKNAVVEIRAGTGGEEAALFAGDLYGMYTRYAERRGWKCEVTGVNESEMGGYNRLSFILEGSGAYGIMKHESGVHRVQRVPKTEAQGRLHTSAATVAVIPEAEDVDVEILPSDLKIENFRAGGPGGQHMQKNDTAVRVFHIPTGLTVVCSNQRSQLQNRDQALRVLRSQLLEAELRKQQEEAAASRREQVKSGDRSEKIRTYNWPQDRVTDHRIGLTVHNIPALMNGEIDDLVTALSEHEDAERLRRFVDEQ